MRIRVGWFPIAIISFLGSTALLLQAGRAEINKVGPQPTRASNDARGRLICQQNSRRQWHVQLAIRFDSESIIDTVPGEF